MSGVTEDGQKPNPATDIVCAKCGEIIQAGQDYKTNDKGETEHANDEDCE